MYNRYIPQPDGSYRRNKVPDPRPPAPPKPPQPPAQDCPPPVPGRAPSPPPKPRPPRKERPYQSRKEPCNESRGIGDFLRRLLPRDFDTSDLLIIILILLMAGDCAEDQNTALLTLAIYLFM